jgi:hypothetical protein
MNNSTAPHAGQEANLILSGLKHFAVVEYAKDPTQFDYVVASQEFTSYIVGTIDTLEVQFHLKDSLLGKSLCAEYQELIALSSSKIAEFGLEWYQREMGRIFGYSQTDIDNFVNGSIKCNCTKCKGVSHE